MVGLRRLPGLVFVLLNNSSPHNEAGKKTPAMYKEGKKSVVNMSETEGTIYCQKLVLIEESISFPSIFVERNSTEICEH